MAYEKLWKLIAPKSFVSNGGTDGRVVIADTVHFKVKQLIILKSSSIPQETYQINRVENSTTLYLGPVSSRIEVRSDLSLFTTGDSATIEAVVQPRSKVPEQEVERITYEEEPTVARRVVLVDPYGDFYTSDNPLPTDPTTLTQQASVSVNGDLGVQNGLSDGGVFGNLALTTANASYEAKVGGSRLANRKNLTIVALDNMYWGYANTVTASNGTPLYKDQTLIFDIDPDSTFQVWLIASAAIKNARITESP